MPQAIQKKKSVRAKPAKKAPKPAKKAPKPAKKAAKPAKKAPKPAKKAAKPTKKAPKKTAKPAKKSAGPAKKAPKKTARPAKKAAKKIAEPAKKTAAPAKKSARPAKKAPKRARAKGTTRARPAAEAAATKSTGLHPAVVAIDRALEALGDDFNIFSSRTRPPSEDEIAAAETELGRALPNAYRAFVAHWGAMVVEVADTVWERPKEFDVRPAWQMDFARMVFGVASDLPPVLRVTAQAASFADRVDEDFLPVLRRVTGNGDVYGFDENDSFTLFNHDTGELEFADDDFVTTLLGEIETLRLDRERLRTDPIAKRDETVDDRERHVVTFDVPKNPEALLTSLRAFRDALEREFPALEVTSEHDDTPFDLASASLPVTFLDGSGGSLDLAFTYDRSGVLDDDFELYVYDNPSSYSLIFRTIAPIDADEAAEKGHDLLLAALEGADLRAAR